MNKLDCFHCYSHLKAIFARHGLTKEIVGDNMTFASSEFGHFAQSWEVAVATSSPEYSSFNGQDERCLQTMKNILRKGND